jgi:hypothetical protein
VGCGALNAKAAVLAIALALPLASRAQDVPGAGDWMRLFNGVDLEGWIVKNRNYPPGDNFGATFRVGDGLLTVNYDQYGGRFDGRYGHLFYERPFSHYRLRIEYRFVGDQVPDGPDWAIRNSGVMLHAQAPDTMPDDQDFPISLEMQFLGGLGDDGRRPTGNLCTPGTNVVYRGQFTTTHCIDSSSPTFDGDQWVLAEAQVLGADRIEYSINGRVVIGYEQPTLGGGAVSGHRPGLLVEGALLGEGYIALQSESHPVQFRRVELLNLEGCMDSRSPSYRAWIVEPEPSACD